jgi:hypothetical protein
MHIQGKRAYQKVLFRAKQGMIGLTGGLLSGAYPSAGRFLTRDGETIEQVGPKNGRQ